MDHRSHWMPRASNTSGGEDNLPWGSASFSSTSGPSTSGLSKPRFVKVRRRPTPRTEVGEKQGNRYQTNSFKVAGGESAISGDGKKSGEGDARFVFGSSRPFSESRSSTGGVGREDRGSAGSGVFVFGSNAEAISDAHLNRGFSGSRSGVYFEKENAIFDSSSSDIGKGLGISLPDRMRGLDIGKDSQQEDVSDSSNYGLGESFGASLPDRIRELDIGKDCRKKDEVAADKPNVVGCGTFSLGGTSTGLGQNMAFNISEKMRSLNIDSSASGFGFGGVKKDDGNAEIARECVRHFVFNGDVNYSNGRTPSDAFECEEVQGPSGINIGSCKDATYSFNEDNASVPEKIKKLNIEDKQKKRQDDANVDFKAATLFSETSSMKTHTPAQNVEHDSAKIPDTTSKLNTEVPAAGPSIFGKADPFIFSSSTNRPVSDSRREIHTRIDESFSSSGIDGRSARKQGSGFNCYSSTIDNSTLPDSKVRTTGQGTSTETGPGCPINFGNHFALNETGSSHRSSVDPASTSVATDFTFTSVATERNMPTKNASFFAQENIFSEMHTNLIFNSKGASKDSRLKKRREKLEKVGRGTQNIASVLRDNSPKEDSGTGSANCYSPMDFSPYEEVLVTDTHSRPLVADTQSRSSISFDDSVTYHSPLFSGGNQPSASADDMGNMVSEAEHLDINETEVKDKETDVHTEKDDCECFLDANTSFVEQEDDGEEEVSKPGQVDSRNTEDSSIYHSSNIGSKEATVISPTSSASDGIPDFSFCSGSDDMSQSTFRFSAVAPTQASFSLSRKRKNEKKRGLKSHHGMLNTEANVESTFLCSSTQPNIPLQTSPMWKHVSHEPPSIFEKKTEVNKGEPNKRPEFEQGPVSSTPESTEVQEVCEKWRLRGNQAYAKGKLCKAEEYYTRGVNCVSSDERSGHCIHALMLCYSNRAATRMSSGRMREALYDCKMAVAMDPNFLKAQVRAANCHLALGETDDASKLYRRCFEILNGDSSGSNILEEASNGLRNSQNVADYTSHSAELLKKRTIDDVNNALQMITKALQISPHSESLIEMKAEALLLLKRYEEVIELCEKTVESSERNSSFFCADGTLQTEDAENKKYLPCKVWRWCLISRSYFYMGRLEEAFGFLKKNELVGPISEKYMNGSISFFASFSATIKELLRLKSAGNDAFQAGRHSDAVEHYTAALMCSIESRPFAAICFCNRAAAYQGVGQVIDAIADCSLAIALDTSYPKAISRRATLYELIRDYDQAAVDLGRLISLMEKRTKHKSCQSGVAEGSTNDWGILKQAHLRLASVEEEARKGISLNMYMILGIESSSSAADIKKAYRKAALKYHPDKAGQLLVKGENNDDEIWKDVCKQVHTDADHLFKMIGEAYSILSDPSKRSQYDLEEEIRTCKRGSGMRQRDSDDFQYSRFERGGNRRHPESSWRSHRSSHSRWTEHSYHSRY